MERSLPMRGRKRPKSPHPAIIPESSRFGLVALAVTLLFLWAALTQQTILRLHHSTHTGLRSGGLNFGAPTVAGEPRSGCVGPSVVATLPLSGAGTFGAWTADFS